MNVVRWMLIGSPALLFAALAACTTSTHSRMMSLAETLERNAVAFASDTHYEPAASDLTTGPESVERGFPGAQDFAYQAEEFRKTVQDRAGDRKIMLAYERLWRGYHTLSDQVERSENRQAKVDFKPVSQAFGAVQNGMQAYADPSLLSRGGYQFDPYYN